MRDGHRKYGDPRPDGALLAGVCAGIASALRWNVWVLRALFIGFAAFKTIAAIGVYAGLALLQHFAPAVKRQVGTRHASPAADNLKSPELSARDRRIEELDRRFRKLEERRNQAN
jgi:phage shock protein PspC (stress-responsive transcriptional regulator)